MNLEKLKTVTNILATVLIPVVVVIIGNSFSKAIKEREVQGKFVELAVNILSQEPTTSTESLRNWATQVMDKYSGVPLDSTTKRHLIRNLQITRTPLFTEGGFKTVTGEREINEIIIRDTQMKDMETEIKLLQQFKVAYHYLIDRDGKVQMLVDEQHIAYHSRGRNVKSIGIGLMHVSGQDYPHEQITALVDLCAEVAGRYDIPVDKLYTAEHVGRKKSDLTPMIGEIRERVRQASGG